MGSTDEPAIVILKKSCDQRTVRLLDAQHLVDRSGVRDLVKRMRALYSDKFVDRSNLSRVVQAFRGTPSPREDTDAAKHRDLHERKHQALVRRHDRKKRE